MMNMRHETETTKLKWILPLALALVLLPAVAGATAWDVDAAHSSVHFSVRHFFTPVPGNFGDFEGTIHYDPEKPAEGSVKFTVQADSIDTGNDNRDEHLRSADFFHVEEYPTLSFESTNVKPAGDNQLMVTGDFTMHGETKKITIPVEFLGAMDTPMGTRSGFSTEFTVDRKDYGINWNRALDSGGAVLGDEVTIEVHVEAKKAEMEEDTEEAAE